MTPLVLMSARNSPEPLPYLLPSEEVAFSPNASKDSEEVLRGPMNLLLMKKTTTRVIGHKQGKKEEKNNAIG